MATKEWVTAVAVLGDRKRASRATALTGGTALAVIGDVLLNLRHAALAPGGATLTVVVVVGEVEVEVPPDWAVDVGVAAVIGDVRDETAGTGPVAPDAPRLAVRGVALFGDVTVRTAE